METPPTRASGPEAFLVRIDCLDVDHEPAAIIGQEYHDISVD
jgi:hypothetical protein